jgi:hypothetical protein
MDLHPTDTSKWAIAIHRVTETTAEVWVGTLFPTMKMPKRARVELWRGNTYVRTEYVEKAEWKRPFGSMNKRFYAVVTFKSLTPGMSYEVEFARRIEATPGVIKEAWQDLRRGFFDTLPRRIPASGSKPFTIGLGSCFYDHRDGGQAAGAYQALYERGPASVRPDITFLTGDQVYLDIGFDSLAWDPDEIRQRVADDYARHWQSLGGILNRGGTWMLPDDHEYWNDYPFHDSLLPTLLALKIDKVRKVWTKASKDAVKNIQRSPRVDIFSIGNDLSICLADLRSFRSKRAFIPDADFQEIGDWARGLRSPGVFVIPQPLIVKPNDLERNLLAFKAQYTKLVEALGESGHDIVLLSGDVHYGRIATCDLGQKGGRLIEVIASPLSNLTYLNGIATSAPTRAPGHFPHRSAAVPGWPRTKVKYERRFEVGTKKGFPISAYPKRRTREHFMTVGFNRRDGGGLKLVVRAWRVRERQGGRNLPREDFRRAFRMTLR